MARRSRPLPRRPKRSIALASLDALKIEGALLQPDMIARIAELDAAQQTEADYGLDPREKLRDVAQTKFALAQSLHARYAGSDQGPQATRRFLSNMFSQVFEFTDLAPVAPVAVEGRNFALGQSALGGRAPVVFAPSGQIDAANAQFSDDGRRRSAAQLLQEYLNADDAALWGLVCDGATLRLYRDNAALTRPAFIEADLTRIFDTDAPRMADFAALWLMVHASRFGASGTAPSDCALERWREEGRKQGATAREKLREGVETALLELGRGFLEHPSNGPLEAELRNGKLTPQAYLQGLLRLVYQFIFVLTAEDRDVLHAPSPDDADAFAKWRAARAAYTGGYSLARLRDRAIKRQHRDRHGDSWEGVKILLRALWRGEPRLALPALGGLFARGEVRDFHDCELSNARLHEAIFRLAWIRTEAGLQRVNWRDMETEELGSVYESLLELSPRLFGAEPFTFIDTRGNDRKTTASYYTPDSLVQALLDETLDPLIEETVKGKAPEQAVSALLDLKIIDPACGSGHFLLAAARRLATRIAQLKSPGAPSPAEFRHWLREAARRCLFGVDRNPMAVELAKVALWIETVEPGKPLTFLDAHIRCGDSLLGIYDLAALQKGIPDEAFAPLTGDDKDAAKAWKARNKAERDGRAQGELGLVTPPPGLLDAARALDAKDEDDLASVEAKANAFRTLLAGPDRWRMDVACDLYVAAFLMPKTAPPGRHAGETTAFIPTSRDVWDKLAGKQPYSLVEAQGVAAARDARAFHWPLEFPQVFFPGAARKPGFDLAVGNPPWERIKLQEQEYFAARAPEIAAAANKAERQQMITALEVSSHESDRRLYAEFLIAKRVAVASSVFARTPSETGGRFPLTGTGDVNTYALFAELFTAISERAGVIVPTGIATDATTAPFFSHLIEKKRLLALISFYEVRRWFPQTDDRKPFCILCLRRDSPSPRFIFSVARINELDLKERWFRLTPPQISAINPNTKTAPIFRSRADAELTSEIYANAQVLINEATGVADNPWGVEFFTMYHMSNDSSLFRTAAQLATDGFRPDGQDWLNKSGKRYVPLMEAKMIHHYDHRWASYEGTETIDVATANKSRPDFEATPRYWVTEDDVARRLAVKNWKRGWLMGWRDIALASVERTAICSVFPTAGVNHKLPIAMIPNADAETHAAMLATWSSLVFDYVARQKISGTSLTYFYLKQLAHPAPAAFAASDKAFINHRVLELCYTSHSMRPFAEDLGYSGSPFAWNEDRRALLRAELDARVARLYGLTREQLRYILDPEDVMGKDYPTETFRVLKNNEIKKHGEYRTARLVLEAWDRDAAGQIEIRQPAIVATTHHAAVALSPGAGARPTNSAPRFAALAQLAAILKALPTATPSSRVRLAALYALEPRFLTPRLPADAVAEWETLVGAEAALPDGGAVAAFVPAIDAHWRNAVTQLTGANALVATGDSWSAGAKLSAIDTDGWPDVRASFVLKQLAVLDEASSISALPAEEQAWVMTLAA
ncbi:MAG: N-6 DNA methylase [Alphaproteobacteria bacterium]|nr:N-6 DNA methylase [Alphaproteobacteria bacterium]